MHQEKSNRTRLNIEKKEGLDSFDCLELRIMKEPKKKKKTPRAERITHHHSVRFNVQDHENHSFFFIY